MTAPLTPEQLAERLRGSLSCACYGWPSSATGEGRRFRERGRCDSFGCAGNARAVRGSDTVSALSPYELYAQTGGGDAYRVAMLEHGYVIPNSPKLQLAVAEKLPGKRVRVCGLTHKPERSEWRDYEDEYGPYQGRWCVVCAQVDTRGKP